MLVLKSEVFREVLARALGNRVGELTGYYIVCRHPKLRGSQLPNLV